MNNSKRVSIIVPVYNMEKLISRCIESILNQTYPNLQLILVDDGSEDRSPEICDKYAEKDDRVLIIHKQNGGVADATNEGLDRATGEFIMFVDSDDYIDDTMVEKLVSAQAENDADIVQTGMSRVNDKNEITEKSENTPCFFSDTDSIIKEFFSGTRILLCLASKLFKKKIFEYFRFEPGRNIIDILATPFLLQKCKSYQIIPDAPYFAYFRSDSVSRGVMTDRTYDDTFYYLEKWGEFIELNYPTEEYFTRLRYRSCYEMSTRYAIVKNSPDVSDKKNKLKKMRDRFAEDYSALIKSESYYQYPKKRRFMLKLFSISPWLMRTTTAIHSFFTRGKRG